MVLFTQNKYLLEDLREVIFICKNAYVICNYQIRR